MKVFSSPIFLVTFCLLTFMPSNVMGFASQPRELGYTETSTSAEWLTCLNDSTKKYCANRAIPPNGLCWDLSETHDDCTVTAGDILWSTETASLPNNSKYSLCNISGDAVCGTTLKFMEDQTSYTFSATNIPSTQFCWYTAYINVTTTSYLSFSSVTVTDATAEIFLQNDFNITFQANLTTGSTPKHDVPYTYLTKIVVIPTSNSASVSFTITVGATLSSGSSSGSVDDWVIYVSCAAGVLVLIIIAVIITGVIFYIIHKKKNRGNMEAMNQENMENDISDISGNNPKQGPVPTEQPSQINVSA